MYLCWNSTSETSASKVAQSLELRKSAEMDPAIAGQMMFLPQNISLA